MAQSMSQNGMRPQKAQRVNENRPLDEAGSEGVQVRLPWEQLSPAPMEQKLDVYFRSEVRVLFCLQDARAEGPLETAVQSPSGHDKFPLILEVRLAPGGGTRLHMARGCPNPHSHTLAGLFVSIQCHPQPLQLLPLWFQYLSLYKCSLLLLPVSAFFSNCLGSRTGLRKEALGFEYLIHENYIYVVSPEFSVLATNGAPKCHQSWVATRMLNSQQSKINTQPKWAVSNRYLLFSCLLSFLFCLSFPLPSSCSRYSPSIRALFLYFCYVYAMSICLYFPALEQ